MPWKCLHCSAEYKYGNFSSCFPMAALRYAFPVLCVFCCGNSPSLCVPETKQNVKWISSNADHTPVEKCVFVSYTPFTLSGSNWRSFSTEVTWEIVVKGWTFFSQTNEILSLNAVFILKKKCTYHEHKIQNIGMAIGWKFERFCYKRFFWI